MTDFDKRFRELRREEEAANVTAEIENARRESEARAKQAALDGEYEKVNAVVKWALAKYSAAGVKPLPIYLDWYESTGQSFFTGKVREALLRSRKLGEAYPLRTLTVSTTSGDFVPNPDKHYMMLAAEDGRIIFPDAAATAEAIHYTYSDDAVRRGVRDFAQPDHLVFDTFVVSVRTILVSSSGVFPGDDIAGVSKRVEEICDEMIYMLVNGWIFAAKARAGTAKRVSAGRRNWRSNR
jgi:hypothetical protein